MDRTIKADLFRHIPSKYNINVLVRGLLIPGFRFTFYYRKAAQYHKRSIRGILYRILHRRCSHKYGFQIPITTSIGEGFYIGHFGIIIISPNAKIGRNCNIAPGVTIGRIGHGTKKGAPRIGDNVWIGTNSIIVGGINIESNVLIAPGAFVNFDVPENSVVIGNPGKIISKADPTAFYIINTISS